MNNLNLAGHLVNELAKVHNACIGMFVVGQTNEIYLVVEKGEDYVVTFFYK